MKINTQRKFEKRICPSCGCEIAENNNFCPICKYEFPAPSKGRNLGVPLVALLLILLLVFLIVRGSL